MAIVKTIIVKPAQEGNADCKAARSKHLEKLSAKIPKDLILPADLLDNPPQDVTQVPRSCGLLSPEELDITENYTLVQLVNAIATRRLTSVEVTKAFCKRAAIAHQLCFCLTDFFMEDAIAQARQYDEMLVRTGKPVGPLHGVPISIKEMVPVKGRSVSAGLVVSMATAPKDCLLVAMLRQMGAVFYCKTHQPHAVFSFECTSFLGRTLNPYNINLTTGGSSGGECALIAMRGSPLGFGTDIAGSIREPAAFCGLYGLKGCGGFMTVAGMLQGPFPSTTSVDGIIGPIGRSLQDIEYIVHHYQAMQPWTLDPAVVPFTLPAPGTDFKPLKVGFMVDDGVIAPLPPVARALAWARERLSASGAQILPFAALDVESTNRLYKALVFPESGNGIYAALEAGNEPKWPVLHSHLNDCRAVTGTAEQSVMQIATHRFERDEYRLAFARHWIEQGNPDVIICPSNFSPALMHDTTKNWSYFIQVWNILDYPAITIPTPEITRESEPLGGEAISDEDGEVRRLWEAGNFKGAPVTLQVVAPRYQEGRLMAALSQMQKALDLP